MFEPQPYNLKPAPVMAIKLTRDNIEDVADWCGGQEIYSPKSSDTKDVYEALDVPTLEGFRRATIGEYVVKGTNGRFYRMEALTFEKRYEPIEFPFVPEPPREE